MRAHFVIAAPYWMRRGDDKAGVPLTPGPSPTGRGEPNPTWVDRILGRGRGRECHVAALLVVTAGCEFHPHPTLSYQGRGGRDGGGGGMLGMAVPLGQAVMMVVGWLSGGGLVVYGAGVRGPGQRTAGVHNAFMLTFAPLVGSRGDCCMTRRWAVAAVQARQRSGMKLLHPRPDVL